MRLIFLTFNADKDRAFNLIELCLSILLISILSLIAIPSWRHYQQSHQADLAINTLVQAIQTAQSFALLSQTAVSLCPSADHLTCQTSWRDSILIFSNPHDLTQPLTHTAIHERVSLKLSRGTLQWRHFRAGSTLTFDKTGLLNHDNGLFYYCPHDADWHFSRALTINTRGRIRLLTQRNAADQLIGPDGKAILCP